METVKFVQFITSKSPEKKNLPIKTPHTLNFAPRRKIFPVLNSTDGPGSSEDNSQPEPAPSTLKSPEPVEIRFKRGSRRRRNKQLREERASSGQSAMAKNPPKKWEEMSLGEKAVEVYMGEKGMLFWLNKFAYASIFIIIGGWILFRFVGPSLNLYQLDAPPLPPTSMFKGS